MAAATALFGLSAFQGINAFQQAQVSNAQLLYRSRIAEQNAAIVRQEGDMAVEMAHRVGVESRRQTSQLLGAQRSAMAGSGFVVGEGTFGDVLDSTAFLGEVDARAIQFEGELTKFRKELEARNLEDEAAALRASRVNPTTAFFSAVLGSPATAAAIRG